MKKRMKRLASLLLAGVMTVSLAACGSGDGAKNTESTADTNQESSSGENEDAGKETSEGDGETTIKITWWGGDSRHEYTQKLLDLYTEKNPNVKFEATPAGWEGYFDKLSTQAASGSMPDIVQMDYLYISTYAKNNSLADLSEFIDNGTIDMSNVDEAILNTGKINGKMAGIVAGTNALAVTYNPDVLSQAGVEAPADGWSWEDYVELNTKVSEKLGKESALTATIGPFGDMNFFNYWVRQKGETLFTEDGTGLAYKDDAALAEYLKMWADMIEKDVAPDPDEQSQIASQGIETLPVVTGEAGTTLEWNTYANKVAATNDKLKLALMPGAADNNAIWMKPGMFWSVAETSKVKEECAKFIDWMTNSEEANDIIAAERGVPISSSIRDYMVNSGKMTAAQTEMFEYIDKVSEIAGECPAADPSGIAEINEAFANAGNSVAYGQATPEEAAKTFRDKATEILERNNK